MLRLIPQEYYNAAMEGIQHDSVQAQLTPSSTDIGIPAEEQKAYDLNRVIKRNILGYTRL